jgi:hypothetical protein
MWRERAMATFTDEQVAAAARAITACVSKTPNRRWHEVTPLVAAEAALASLDVKGEGDG